jgi:hypothetical protein
MDREGADAMRLAARVQGQGVESVGGLRLSVGDPLVVGAPLELRVVEVDARAPTIAVAPAPASARVVASPIPA